MKNINDVYLYIRNKIESKQLFPGQKIIEEQLANELKMSRSSIRNAFAKLQYEGFIDLVPNRGAFITKLSPEEAQDLYNVRLHLELGAFNEAVKNVDQQNLDILKELLEQQERQLNSFSITQYAKLNRQFHEEIAKASKNQFFVKYLKEVYNRTSILLIFYDNSHNNAGSFVTHSAIYEALRDRDLNKGLDAVRADNTLALEDLSMAE